MVYEKKTGENSSPGRSLKDGKRRGPGRPKSPGRTVQENSTEKSSSRQKSVDRSKSPKKIPERSGRLTPTRRSPVRRSPARFAKIGLDDKEKTKAKFDESAIPVLRKKLKITEIGDTESDTADKKTEVKEKPKAAVRGRSRTDLTEILQGYYEKEPTDESVTSSLLKRVTRSQNREVERIVHLKHFETISKKIAEFSDEEELLKEPSISKSDDIRRSYDNPIGLVLVMLSLPILAVSLFAFCNKSSCFFTKMPENLSKFTNISSYFDARAYFGYIGYIIFLTLLSALPFGGRKVPSLPDKQEKYIYVMNGLFSILIIALCIIGLELKNFQITKYIINHYFQLYAASLLIGIFLSVLAYIRSFYVPVSALNPYIINKSKVLNFFMGRELHPRLFGIIDLKIFVYRLLNITSFLVDFALVYHSLAVNIQWGTFEKIHIKAVHVQPTVLIYLLLHSIYIFDGLVFEHTRVSTKEIQQEGFGYYMSVNYLTYPFITSFVTKYIIEYDVQLAYWKLVLITLVFLVGYIIYRCSNNQKDAFRKNPYSPSFSHLETIPTAQGKKLLSSGFWGFVRHPNYLGNILMELSLLTFVLNSPPMLIGCLSILCLIYRARRDNFHCKQKYGAAWDRYCNRVRYILLPKVY